MVSFFLCFSSLSVNGRFLNIFKYFCALLALECLVTLPVGVLISEHRLIERTVGLVRAEREKIEETVKIDPDFVAAAVDFFRVYTDRFHHGKEEGEYFSRSLQAWSFQTLIVE